MSRIRYLKPEFFKDEDLADLPIHVRLFYAGLWCCADKAGRLKDRARRIKVDVYPYDDIDVESCLEQLAKPKTSSGRPFIERYVVDGERYIQIVQWDEHQKPHHTERESDIPGMDGFLDDNPSYPNRSMRKTIYERDGYKCLYCGRDLHNEPRMICLDHVIPIVMDGSNHQNNLATACKKCNAKKAGRIPEDAGMLRPCGLGSTIHSVAPSPHHGDGDGEGNGDGKLAADTPVHPVLSTCQHPDNTPSSVKQRYLDHVELTDDEYDKLVQRYGEEEANDRIAELNDAIASKGYDYKSHYATILAWERRQKRELEQQQTRAGAAPEPFKPPSPEIIALIDRGLNSAKEE